MKEKGSILVIDDERSLLEMLEQFLSERGFDVTTAASGSAAVEKLSAGSFDVALVDLKLPDRDGLELLEEINKKYPGTRCIVMTAFASLESTIEALRLNAFDYILKPFDLLKIAEVTEAACEHAAMVRENTEVIKRLETANRQLEKSREDLSDRVLRTNDELGRANESLKKHVTRLKMLYQMGRDISSNENWSDALDRFLMALCKYLEAEGAAILLFSNSISELKVRTTFNIDDDSLGRARDLLLAAQEKDLLRPEIFNLEGCDSDDVQICLAQKKPWKDSVIPLLYKGRWLGFLLIRKMYRSRQSYLMDYHFINTIQTILTEEVANAVNISRLRNLKDFNETILDSINSGVIKTDYTGTVVFRNSRAREILGPLAESQVRLDEIFQNPFGKGSLFEHLTCSEERNLTLESYMALPGREPVPVSLNSTKVRVDDYQGTSIVAVFEDLTSRKAMEEELRRADRLRSLGELSAGVAHEIRNPLTGIATTAQVLKEQLEGESEKMEYMTVILDEIKRLDDIIANLLNFARPVTPKLSEISVNRLVEETMMLLEERARENGVKISFENQIDDDHCVLDSDQIKQVILNVGMNGIQACEEGGKMTVYLTGSDDPVFIRLEFLDDGCGIPGDISDKLYNPFFTTRSDGTGLGLSISRKIVESHGGTISHETEAGRGTKFIVELPRRMASSMKTDGAEQVS